MVRFREMGLFWRYNKFAYRFVLCYCLKLNVKDIRKTSFLFDHTSKSTYLTIMTLESSISCLIQTSILPQSYITSLNFF